MRIIPVATILLSVLAASVMSCTTPETPKNLSIPQLESESVPPPAPELLAPGVVSTHNGERDAAFLPDRSAFYYTLWTGRFGVIIELVRDSDGRYAPAVASFSGRYSDLEPFVTPDGRKLFFASNRPATDDGEPKDYDIWYVERDDAGWGSPVRLGDSVNTAANEFYPSVDSDGTLYFTAAYAHSVGGEDIWLSRPIDGSYVTVENAGPGVNTERDEFNALIAPDGSFLAFSSFGREDGLGGGDLYVSFRGDDGVLGTAVHPGSPINSEALDFSPALSPDGKTFFFSSRRTAINSPSADPWSYEALTDGLDGPANGDLDIYLVSTSFLRALQPAN